MFQSRFDLDAPLFSCDSSCFKLHLEPKYRRKKNPQLSLKGFSALMRRFYVSIWRYIGMETLLLHFCVAARNRDVSRHKIL